VKSRLGGASTDNYEKFFPRAGKENEKKVEHWFYIQYKWTYAIGLRLKVNLNSSTNQNRLFNNERLV
jgi:hypothetical protein